MTQPGTVGHSTPDQTGQHAIGRQLEDLRREVRELRRLVVQQGQMVVPSGNSITVQNGAAVPVLDSGGNTVAMLGTISGVTDVHSLDPVSGNILPLAQLAFGAVGANDGGTGFTQTTINTWQAGSMALTVECKTGRLLVLVQAAIIVGGAASASETAVMSWNLAGPTTVGPATNRGVGAGVINGSSPVVPGFNLGMGGYLHTGLTPGSYTVTDEYQTSINSGSYTGRSMVVIPF